MPVLFAFLLAQVLGLIVFFILPHSFNPNTDIVGFPIHSNFNIDHYYQLYFIEAILVPLLWWGIYRLRSGPLPIVEPTSVTRSTDSQNFGLPLTTAQWCYWTIPLSLLLLPLLSMNTTATDPKGVVNHFPWMSWKLTLVLIVLAYIAFIRMCPSTKEPPPLKRAIFGLLLPLILFLWHSHLPQPRSWIHLYHDGESLVPSLLWQQGYFPWRDFLYTHGLLQDPLLSWVGHYVFENTVWGSDAGAAVLLAPLYFVAWYFLCLRLVVPKKGILILFCFILPLLYPLFFERFNLRFIFLPFVLLLLDSFFEHRTPTKGWGLGFLLAGTLFLTPELLPFTGCCLIVIAIHSFWKRVGFGEIINVTLSFSLALGAIAYLLHQYDALLPFIRVYADEGLHYRYESGIPLPLHLGTWFSVALAIPWLAFFWGTAYFYSAFKNNRMHSTDWMMLSYHAFSIVYFAKFLCRPDTHILAHTAIALPLILYLLSQLKVISPRLAYLTAFLGLLLTIPQLKNRIDFHKFQIKVPERSEWSQFGFRSKNPVADEIISDLDQLFRTVLAPEDAIFDFTNEPALFHYLLKRRPASRYPFVIVAASEKSQDKMIEDLRRSQPKLVVYSSQLDYASWDGVPGMVRHYKVSQYLLEHYKPFVVFKHHAIFQRRDLSLSYQSANTLPVEGVYHGESCDWGYAPQVLKASVSRKSREIPHTTRKTANGYVTELALEPEDFTQSSMLELNFMQSDNDAFSLVDEFQSPSDQKGMVQFKTLAKSNYRYAIPVGSCLQWHGFKGQRVFLSHRKAHQISAVRLYRSPFAYPSNHFATGGHVR